MMLKAVFFQDFQKPYNQRDRKSQTMRVELMPKKQNGRLKSITLAGQMQTGQSLETQR